MHIAAIKIDHDRHQAGTVKVTCLCSRTKLGLKGRNHPPSHFKATKHRFKSQVCNPNWSLDTVSGDVHTSGQCIPKDDDCDEFLYLTSYIQNVALAFQPHPRPGRFVKSTSAEINQKHAKPPTSSRRQHSLHTTFEYAASQQEQFHPVRVSVRGRSQRIQFQSFGPNCKHDRNPGFNSTLRNWELLKLKAPDQQLSRLEPSRR